MTQILRISNSGDRGQGGLAITNSDDNSVVVVLPDTHVDIVLEKDKHYRLLQVFETRDDGNISYLIEIISSCKELGVIVERDEEDTLTMGDEGGIITGVLGKFDELLLSEMVYGSDEGDDSDVSTKGSESGEPGKGGLDGSGVSTNGAESGEPDKGK